MRVISADKIKDTVADLSVQANTVLRRDILDALKKALKKESNKTARDILKKIINNGFIAKKEALAICQDTGLPCIFLELGQNVRIEGGLNQAINKGIELGYKKGFLRSSIVKDPLSRANPGYQPGIIHTDIVGGDRLKITVLPKGFGCENKSGLKMFKPTAKLDEVKKFILDTVKNAGADACPPFILGVGIGGTADYACFLSKKALLRKIRNPKSKIRNPKISKLEKELFLEINKLNIGPMGLGGKTTCLGVNIAAWPTHIAGLPVAVNISCHALRSAAREI